ncbi:MAG TPA: hypothetical protein VJX31_05370 [Casimicrobiaceae bacterium]|nr:hypothetical protein [Casimicrobiaceae bacterium]
MSIYSGSRRGWKDLNDVVQPIGRRDQQAPAANHATALRDVNDWTALRKARPAEHLLPLTEKWFDGFPSDRAPCALASQYPRVCNMIAVLWNDHRGAPELFEDLLTDKRGGRAGFPPAVRRDLHAVQEYWYTGALKL